MDFHKARAFPSIKQSENVKDKTKINEFNVKQCFQRLKDDRKTNAVN